MILVLARYPFTALSLSRSLARMPTQRFIVLLLQNCFFQYIHTHNRVRGKERERSDEMCNWKTHTLYIKRRRRRRREISCAFFGIGSKNQRRKNVTSQLVFFLINTNKCTYFNRVSELGTVDSWRSTLPALDNGEKKEEEETKNGKQTEKEKHITFSHTHMTIKNIWWRRRPLKAIKIHLRAENARNEWEILGVCQT